MVRTKKAEDQSFRLHLESKFEDSELFIALVHSLGTNHKHVVDEIKTQLQHYNYEVHIISMTKNVIEELYLGKSPRKESEFKRLERLIESGNKARSEYAYNGILALGAINCINTIRSKRSKERGPLKKTAFIITSLKHQEEVRVFRKVYGIGFYLIGVFSEENERLEFLKKRFGMTHSQARNLIDRDTLENFSHGQKTSEAFHLSDFFVHYSHDTRKLNADINKIINLLFGNPAITPTFDEYAMFMAFSAACRSGDLSRQVGAVIAKNNEILSTGANDCPACGGGQYWPTYSNKKHDYIDYPKGRDLARKHDSNSIEKAKIVNDLSEGVNEKIQSSLQAFKDDFYKSLNVSAKSKKELLSSFESKVKNFLSNSKVEISEFIEKSQIKDLTEYGRVVHAEMAALTSCARMGINTQDADLFCTTFPCHNCAKHIIAAGIRRVVFVEPYAKSKTLAFHDESVILSLERNKTRVSFAPFVGVGARRFIDLFSMSQGIGDPLKRKGKDGKILSWEPNTAKLRIQLLPNSYLGNEFEACILFSEYFNKLKDEK